MLFGDKQFVPMINSAMIFAPPQIFAALAYNVFFFLFKWSDTRWVVCAQSPKTDYNNKLTSFLSLSLENSQAKVLPVLWNACFLQADSPLDEDDQEWRNL